MVASKFFHFDETDSTENAFEIVSLLEGTQVARIISALWECLSLRIILTRENIDFLCK